jgi:hypothetical protein
MDQFVTFFKTMADALDTLDQAHREGTIIAKKRVRPARCGRTGMPIAMKYRPARMQQANWIRKGRQTQPPPNAIETTPKIIALY